MDFEEIEKKLNFSSNQLRYLKRNNLIIIEKKELEKFKYIKYEKSIDLLISRIMDVFFSQFKEKIKIYCKFELDDFSYFATEDIKRLIECFMEFIYNYKPSWKKTWSGKDLKEKTIEAIKRNKIFELVFRLSDNTLIYIDCNLYMNRKKAEKILNALNKVENTGKFILIERSVI